MIDNVEIKLKFWKVLKFDWMMFLGFVEGDDGYVWLMIV